MRFEEILDKCWSDLRRAARQLWKSPGYSAAAIITLALGIGVNTAIFTLTNAVLLEQLPISRPQEVVSLGDSVLNGDTALLQDSFTLYSHALYRHIREQTSGTSGVAAVQSWLATVSARRANEQRPVPARVAYVSGNYFSVLGVATFSGRALRDDDDQPGSPAVAVMSYAAWTRNGRDQAIIGDTVVMNGIPVTIVGVAAPGFFGETLRSDPPDYWLPLSLEPATTTDNPLLNKDQVFWLYVLARIAPTTNIERLQHDVTLEVRRWIMDRHLFPESEHARVAALRVAVTPASGGIAGLQRTYGEGLRLLTVLSAFVLAIVCVNVANLLLARGAQQRSELAVRVALGARRSRLISAMITEGLLLAASGGVAGVAVSALVTPAIVALALRNESSAPFSTAPSLPVIIYALSLAMFTGLLLSAVPAWRNSNAHPAEALRGAGRGTPDSDTRPQRWLLAGQAIFSLVLLAGAGLLTTTLRNLEQQSLGFSRERVAVIGLNPALDGYDLKRLPVLYRKLDDRLAHIPGAVSASYALHAPLDDWNWGARLQIEGRPVPSGTVNRAWYSRVSPRYFETIGTRLVRGRALDEHDNDSSVRVAVVNETFVSRYFPDQDPLGRHFGYDAPGHGRDFEIVGVVENAKYRDVRQPAEPMFFLPFTQTVSYQNATQAAYQRWSMFIDGIQVRATASTASIRRETEQAINDVDPNLTILHFRPLSDYVDVQLNSPRLLARLTELYGALALLLACVGLYGVTAYSVTRRTRDIGIRMALGAKPWQLVMSVCRQALTPVVLGVLVGVPAAFAGRRAIASQLFGNSNGGVVIVAAAALVLCLSAFAAAMIPARWAAKVDPLVAMRE